MNPLKLIILPSRAVPALATEKHSCSYLPGRQARELVLLAADVDSAEYQVLMDRGFRRSGELFYKAHCPACEACRPIRVPVAGFVPSRSQRRVWRKNQDVRVQVGSPELDERRWALFRRYQDWRHDGTMCATWESYEHAYCVSPLNTVEMSYWLAEELVGIGIVDVTPQALSSVYFYFDPAHAQRGLGVFSGLCEIEECRRRGLPYWYIGYHVAGCAKMEYKARFQPYELLRPEGTWAAQKE